LNPEIKEYDSYLPPTFISNSLFSQIFTDHGKNIFMKVDKFKEYFHKFNAVPNETLLILDEDSLLN